MQNEVFYRTGIFGNFFFGGGEFCIFEKGIPGGPGRYYTNSTGCPPESVLSLKCHVCFASRCPGTGGQAPRSLPDDCCIVYNSTRRSLRSADVPTCVVPRTFSSYSDRTFAVAGPRLCNSLSVQLRNLDITVRLFRRQMKEHFFSEP